MTTTTFVSAFYPLKRPEGSKILSSIEFLDNFKQLVRTGIDIVFFHDGAEVTMEALNDLKDCQNLKAVEMPMSKLNTFITIDEASGNSTIELPSNRNKPKDTTDFMTIMLSKPEFIKIASTIRPSNNYAWIDAGIFKIVYNKVVIAKALQFINNLSTSSVPNNKITIPGCWEKTSTLNDIYNQINWRFCGGLFIVPSQLVEDFDTVFSNKLKEILSNGRLMWEVNVLALIEQDKPELFNWFKADHNDSMFKIPTFQEPAESQPPIEIQPINSSGSKKVILLTMVKNEEKIIERLIRSTLNVCDAICVCDTGSTDKTCEIVERLKEELAPIPVGLYHDSWQNFGHNRSLSFTNGQDFCNKLGWNPKDTYGLLLDGDMVLKVGPTFNKDMLTDGGYLMIQSNSSIDYHNTRLVRFSDSWKCVGVTHEYWDGPGRTELPKDMIYIHDIGDGGCKSDKFERDIRLLTEGIEKEPNNERYHFYLAQSYKDTNQHEKSIEFYKKRIALGGWAEEVFYSYYMIAKLYLNLKKVHKAEKWAMKAYNYRQCRGGEALYFLVNHFREIGQQYKAMHYYKMAKQVPYPKDLLFVEKNIYNYLLDYEYTILHYYVSPNNQFYGTKFCLEYMNKHRHSWENVFTNLQYYMPRLCDNFTPIKINATCPDTDFRPSSVSLAKYNDQLFANIRFVNYKIRPDGGYDMMENGVYSPNNWVRTLNGYQYFNWNTLQPITNVVMMNDIPNDVPLYHATNIRGMEDVRIAVRPNGTIQYTATSRQCSSNGKNRITIGDYDICKQRYTNNMTVNPPTETDCEKNWTTYGDDIIYSWSPMRIGKANKETKQLEIHTTHQTPIFFERVRGSSEPILYNGKLWCVTHSVLYQTPRKYYHHLIVMDPTTYKPLRMSLPFAFRDTKIEYCLGFIEHNDNFIFTFSFNDSEPHFIKVPIDWFERHMMVDI